MVAHRAEKTFSGGPSAALDVSRRTARPDPRWGHRESPPIEVNEEGKRSPNYRGEACLPESFFDRVTQALRGDIELERDRRLQLADTVSKHRAEFAFAQLESERALTSPPNELRVARVDVDRSRAEITALQTLVDAHHREHKALCEMLKRKGVLNRKKQRTGWYGLSRPT
uniref:Periplasmic heavy metal sensor n=1 Tax=Peronospora matthiolae TaxID=2874970 RepID=A0AAV1UJI1_9STRA